MNIVERVSSLLDASPTPYHAVALAKAKLLAKGFVALDEREPWQLEAGGRYFVERRQSSLIAFKTGDMDFAESGFRIIGAHTDSPVLKVKPKPEKCVDGYLQLSIEVYGGALFAPWFDRDLSLAGKVNFVAENGPCHALVDFKDPIAVIPSLAIHLDRAANEGKKVNPQDHLKPILGQLAEDESYSFTKLLCEKLAEQGVTIQPQDILDFDFCFYDTQKAACVGLKKEFLASARLDNLLSSFVGLNAFLETCDQKDNPSMLALFDHEEVGSQSDIGARSNFLPSVIERVVANREQMHLALRHSTLLSVDNAHGIHPNYRNVHEENHGPLLNAGPVVKYDANQGYATSSQSAVFLKHLAREAGVPVQSFVMRADMRCGSTIGPMTAAETGISTVDIGVPTFAMHSIRELAGTQDVVYLNAILRQYLETRSFSL